MRKINVLFIQSQSFFGSDSLMHSLMMRYFDRDRLVVHVACNRGTKNEESASLRALRELPDVHLRPTDFGTTLNYRSGRQILTDTLLGGVPAARSLAGLVHYARKHRIDIIHGTEKPRDAFYGLLLARAVGARHIVHLHVKVDHSWMSPLTKWAMRHTDHLIGVSQFVADSAVQAGYPRERVSHALNSLEAWKWDPNTDGSGIRREFSIPSDVPVLVTISRLFPWKGHTLLLRALGRVKEKNPKFRLLIVGEDDMRATPGNRRYSEELKKLTAELELDEQVTFTGFRRDVAALLAGSDIYAMPTFEEPCAVAFLEAMAMRKPVIALASGGTVQLVDEKSGLLSAPQDVEGLAANILALLSDGERRRAMGAHARRRVEEYFTPQRMANDVERIYRSMLGLPMATVPDYSVPVTAA